MPQVVLLRAVNVAGRNLRPRALADALGLVNVGAAGTFVSPDGRRPRALERAIRAELPFETDVMICSGESVLGLLRGAPFGEAEAGIRWYVSVLGGAPKARPRVPFQTPSGKDWQVRVVRVVDRYVLSLRRRTGARFMYSNEVVEKAFGVPATTRGWETMVAIGRALGS